MLAGILSSDTAVEMSLKIVNTFIAMRKYINNNLIEQNYINKLVIKDHERIKFLEESFNKLEEKTKINSIFFAGQIYDAYSLLVDILNKSKNEVVIIDNYIDKNLLDVLSKTKKKVTIVTNKYNNQDYEKYKEQYNNVKLIINNDFHDRFIIIDRKILYHCGASFKDLGKKCFEITKIEDKDILNNLIIKLFK